MCSAVLFVHCTEVNRPVRCLSQITLINMLVDKSLLSRKSSLALQKLFLTLKVNYDGKRKRRARVNHFPPIDYQRLLSNSSYKFHHQKTSR